MDENKKKQKTLVPTYRDGSVGIRATLKNMGFSDRDIGYDEGSQTVTLKGKNLIKPSYMDEDAGVSYAKNSDIQKSVVDFFKDSDNPMVRVSDAYASTAGRYGLNADALSYGNGTVSIGGRPIEISYIDDEGKAWARQNTVERASEAYANRVGVQSPTDVFEDYAEEYIQRVKAMGDRLMQKKEFQYDPESDPAYKAYRSVYRTEANRAGENAAAQYMTLTGGYANSAAATAGAQANQYYAQQLAGKIPELAQAAYERYLDKYRADIDLMGQMTELYERAYQNAVEANTQQRKNANESAAAAVQRDEKAAERAAALWEMEWKDKQNQQSYAAKERENEWDVLFDTQQLEKNRYTNEGLRLSNEKQRIYQKYYDQLLREELYGAQTDNATARLKLQMLG